MALIVLQYEIADQYPVASTFASSVPAGTMVGINTDGTINLATKTNVLGIAGDSITASGPNSAYAADLVISPSGKQRYTQNRVSDYFDETSASAQMTVYVGPGKFATDQYTTTDNYTLGGAVYSTSVGKVTTDSSSSALKIGKAVAQPTAYPSGVPGTDVAGSMALGTFLTFVMNVQ